jgi:16S rRNA (guanine966-N2)-methyltransferase
VLLLEQDAALVAQLRAVQQRLAAQAVTVQRGDGVAGLKALAPASVDLVFLDPPFAAGLYDGALRACVPALAAGARVYLEAPDAWDDSRLAALGLGLVVYRQLKAGAVHAHLLRQPS